MKRVVLTPIISKEDAAIEAVINLWRHLKELESKYGYDSKSADRARTAWDGAFSIIKAMDLKKEYISALTKSLIS